MMRKYPKNNRNSGFTLVEMMFAVAIIATLTAMSFPNVIKARLSATKNACIGNLHQIEAAKRIWSLEKEKISTDVPVDSDIFGMTSFVRDKPVCPAGGSYNLNAVGSNPTCSLAASQSHTL
jgi:prepilin-type N-terminal cleavage/methylation domain-containing protein